MSNDLMTTLERTLNLGHTINRLPCVPIIGNTKYLSEFKNDGTLAELSEEWFGVDYIK